MRTSYKRRLPRLQDGTPYAMNINGQPTAQYNPYASWTSPNSGQSLVGSVAANPSQSISQVEQRITPAAPPVQQPQAATPEALPVPGIIQPSVPGAGQPPPPKQAKMARTANTIGKVGDGIAAAGSIASSGIAISEMETEGDPQYSRREKKRIEKIKKGQKDSAIATASGAGIAAIGSFVPVAGPIIAAVGSGIAAGGGVGTTMWNKEEQEFNEDYQKRLARDQERINKENGLMDPNAGGPAMDGVYARYEPQEPLGRNGGYGRNITKYRYGGQRPNAELEGGEKIMRAGGTVETIPKSAPSHPQGGVDKYLAPGDFVWSHDIKVPDPRDNSKEISMADLFGLVQKSGGSPEKIEQLKALQQQIADQRAQQEGAPQQQPGRLPTRQTGTPIDPRRSKFGRATYGALPYVADTAGFIAQMAAAGSMNTDKVDPIKHKEIVAEDVKLSRNVDTGAGERQRDAARVMSDAQKTMSAPQAMVAMQTAQQAKHRADQKAVMETRNSNVPIDLQERVGNANRRKEVAIFNEQGRRSAAESNRKAELEAQGNKNAQIAAYGQYTAGYMNDLRADYQENEYTKGLSEGTGIYEANREFNMDRYIRQHQKQNKSTYQEALDAFTASVAALKK